MRGAVLLLLASVAVADGKRVDPKVELGRRLFMDPAVSRSGRVSCSSCHLPEHGFSDPRVLSEDESGTTRRHSQPILDLAKTQPLHWDGEFRSMRTMLTIRLATAVEARNLALTLFDERLDAAREAGRFVDDAPISGYGLVQPRIEVEPREPAEPVPPVDGLPVEVRLSKDGLYRLGFVKVWGTRDITMPRILGALEAYMLSVRSGETAFDRFRAGDAGALTDRQRVGLSLFTGEAGCVACHTIDGAATFTDGKLHNTGVAFHKDAAKFDPALDLSLLFDFKDGGAGEVTLFREELGAFKTPTLRDVARRPPYMHDGSLKTLEEVVRYYSKGGTPNAGIDPRIRPLHLSDWEVGCLVEFLESLTSDVRPGLGPAPTGRRLVNVRVMQGYQPVPGLVVRVVPAGDRLEGAMPDEAPREYTTSSTGYFTFEFPKWTHVRLVSRKRVLRPDRLIPDFATEVTVTVGDG